MSPNPARIPPQARPRRVCDPDGANSLECLSRRSSVSFSPMHATLLTAPKLQLGAMMHPRSLRATARVLTKRLRSDLFYTATHLNCNEKSFAATRITSSCTRSPPGLPVGSVRVEPPPQLAVAAWKLPRRGSESQRRYCE